MAILNKRVPILWNGRDLIAEHADTCRCYEQSWNRTVGHDWRILYADTLGYLFDEKDGWVVKHATELWSEDDPFGEAFGIALCDYCGHEQARHSRTDGPCEECAAMPKETTAYRKAWHSFEMETDEVTPLCTMCGVPGCEGGCSPSYAP